MTSTDFCRLLHLERLFRNGNKLSGSETWELERLRDEAGQRDLFPAIAPELPLGRDASLIDRGAVIAQSRARLVGFDAGEQSDAFGQGLLL